MKLFASQHGIMLPADNLSERIFLFEKKNFEAICDSFGQQSSAGRVNGFILSNRLCFVNYDAIKTQLRERKAKQTIQIAIHELWHSVEYSEIWTDLEANNSSTFIESPLRRAGFATASPPQVKPHSPGLALLSEAFTQYLTLET